MTRVIRNEGGAKAPRVSRAALKEGDGAYVIINEGNGT